MGITKVYYVRVRERVEEDTREGEKRKRSHGTEEDKDLEMRKG